MGMTYWFVRILSRLLTRIFGPVSIYGAERVPRSGGALIIANHLSNADPVVIAASCPRKCWFMAKEELFRIRFLGWFIRQVHAFPVSPRSADRSAIRTAESLLKQGKAVVIFPEGECSETGRMAEFLPGAAMIARRSNVPVVPVGLIGTQRIVPYGRLWPRRARGVVVIRYGEPFDLAEISDRAGSYGQIVRRMMETVAALAEQPIPAEYPQACTERSSSD